jgi:arsenate reductase-like glutaredoxin family protein
VHDRDFFKQPFSEAELRGLLAGTAPADAFAWNSPRARAASLSRQDPPPDEELIRLMLETPYLIRRPVIRIGERTLFGFDQREVEPLLG